MTPARALPGTAEGSLPPREGFAGEPHRTESAAPVSVTASPALLPAPAPRLEAEPLTPTVTRLHVSVSPAFLEKLEAARIALSHSMPGASDEDVLSAGRDLIIARDAKRKGLAAKPRPAPPEDQAIPGATYIPAAVKGEVWRRDGGCCQYPLDSGGVCGSRIDLQFDHVEMIGTAREPGTSACRSASP